jgi:hypothetical protein
LWLAIPVETGEAFDPVTKILPSLHLGKRKNVDAMILLHDLKLRLHNVIFLGARRKTTELHILDHPLPKFRYGITSCNLDGILYGKYNLNLE